jgi:hypothetical protein
MSVILTTRVLADDTCFMFNAERVKDNHERLKRFERRFRIQFRMWDLVNALFDQETLKLRGGDERDLSLLVGASLGKALKTFAGVHELCLMGWGEDALILLRSNVNLLINLGYILGDSEPAERGNDFIAFSYLERMRYLKAAHADKKQPWKSLMSDDELKMRAERWRAVGIKGRAERVPGFHYTNGYALYSSFEHSDAMALNTYIAEWNELGPRIHAGPSDDHIAAALWHNAMVLADVLYFFCGHFGIKRPDIFDSIKKLLNSIKE